MYQTWQWPTQTTDTTYAQPATAVAPSAAPPAAAVAASTWPMQYGQYAVAANMQQQWAWAAQNQYAYAASFAAGQQGNAAAAYPGVWPGQTAAAPVATDPSSVSTTTVAAAVPSSAVVPTAPVSTTSKTTVETSKEELAPKDISEMEKMNQLRAQAQQWTSQQQTAAWGMQTGAAPATAVTPAVATSAPTSAANTAASWGQGSWNHGNWNAGQQWPSGQNQWQQTSVAPGTTTTTQGGSQPAIPEAAATTGTQHDSQTLNDANSTESKQVDTELEKEEEEFDRQFTEWEKQFDNWKEQNKNHPDKEAFAQYEKQWKDWREQLLQKKEEMKKKKDAKRQNASDTAQVQGSSAETTATSNIPGLDIQEDKSSVTTMAPTSSIPPPTGIPPTIQPGTGIPPVQAALPTATVAPAVVPPPTVAPPAMDPTMMFQNQMRMPPQQQYMYMPPQQYMYPPTMPPPMMPPQQPQAMSFPPPQQPPPMMGQADQMQNPTPQQPPPPPVSENMPPVKRPLLATPPPPANMPPGGPRFDRPGDPNQMRNEAPPDMMQPPPGGRRMEPQYGPRDPHMRRSMEEESYEEDWGYNRGPMGMDFFRGRGRGGPMRGRGRGRGGGGGGQQQQGHWGEDFDGRPPEHEMGPPPPPGPGRQIPPGRQFDPDLPPDRFRPRPGLDPDAFDPEFSVMESTKFPPDPNEKPFEEGDFDHRGGRPPFPERRFGPEPPFDDQGAPFHDRPRFPREPPPFEEPQMFPERFGERFPPDRFPPPPENFDDPKRLPQDEDFNDKRFPPDEFDESGPPGNKRFPSGPSMHPRDEGRFMGDRYGPPRPPFGPGPPGPPFEGDFPPPPPFDDRFGPFPDEGFRRDRGFRMRGPPREFGPDRFPPGEPPFGPPNFPPGDRFRFADDRDMDFRGPDRDPPFRGGRFQIDYENRPASTVMGDDFNKKYDAFEPQFGSDIINYRDSCYMGYEPKAHEPIIFSHVDVERIDYAHGKSDVVKSIVPGKKTDKKEEKEKRSSTKDYDYQRRDRSPLRDRNFRDREADRKDKDHRRDRNRDGDRDERNRDTDRDRIRDRHRDRDDRKDRDMDRDRERDRNREINERESGLGREKDIGAVRERDGPRRSRWEPREDVPIGKELSPDTKGQNGDRSKENVSGASDNSYAVPKDVYNSDPTGDGVQIKDLLYIPGRINRPKQLVIILRGLPGSGKTHVARLIKDKEVEQGGCAPRILSLDDYFMVETEVDAVDEETGRKIKKKEFQYEYEAAMEEAYRSSLLRSFKKTIDERFFPFIVVDAVHNEVKQFEPFWSYAKQRGFQVYVAELDCFDPLICHKRNVHKRSLDEITAIQNKWESKPRHFLSLDIRALLQDVSIPEVEMEDSMAGPKSADENETSDLFTQFHVPSKWEKFEATEEKLDQLDGLRIKKKHTTMEDYLQLPDDYEERQSEPGKKRVRWADLEERKEQDRLRAIGFVVGQTDWSKMTDPSHADRALTRTKYI